MTRPNSLPNQPNKIPENPVHITPLFINPHLNNIKQLFKRTVFPRVYVPSNVFLLDDLAEPACPAGFDAYNYIRVM